MFKIKKYRPPFKVLWDTFVDRSLQSNFIFYRDYLEYHSDRFRDQSILIFAVEKLVAIFPCNSKEETIESHGGLTFGGLLWDERLTMENLTAIFSLLIRYFAENGYKRLIYKTVPSIYHKQPAEADRYLLFHHNAEHHTCSLSSVIPLKRWMGFAKGQQQSLKLARAADITLSKDSSLSDFMSLLSKHLMERYNSKPLHTFEELSLLSDFFPDQIRLHTASQASELIAGIILFKTARVVRVQYIASSKKGFQTGAVPLILNAVIEESREVHDYLDLGTSNIPGHNGQINQGLLHFKEMLGARLVSFDSYSLSLDNS